MSLNKFEKVLKKLHNSQILADSDMPCFDNKFV